MKRILQFGRHWSVGVRLTALAALAALVMLTQTAQAQFGVGIGRGGVGVGFGTGWGGAGWGGAGWGSPGWGGYGWGSPGWGGAGWGTPGWGRTGWGTRGFTGGYYSPWVGGGYRGGYRVIPRGYYGGYTPGYSYYATPSYQYDSQYVTPQYTQPYEQQEGWFAQRGALGVTVHDRTGRVVVSNVFQGSAAQQAGLQVGDEIAAVGGRAIRSHAELTNQLRAAAEADAAVELSIRRDGVQTELLADIGGRARPDERIAARPDFDRFDRPDHTVPGRLGVTVQDRDARVRIDTVAPQSAAAQAGLRPGDEIRAVNGQPIRSHSQLVSHLQAAAQADGYVELSVMRNGQQQQVQADVSGTARQPEERVTDIEPDFPEDARRQEQPPYPERPDDPQRRAEPLDAAERPRVTPREDRFAEQPQPRRPVDEARQQQGGILGISVSDTEPLRVERVFEGSAAAQAGLQQGDELLSINEQRVFSERQMNEALRRAAQADSEVSLLVRRNDEQIRISADISAQAEPEERQDEQPEADVEEPQEEDNAEQEAPPAQPAQDVPQ